MICHAAVARDKHFPDFSNRFRHREEGLISQIRRAVLVVASKQRCQTRAFPVCDVRKKNQRPRRICSSPIAARQIKLASTMAE
jgi:hypothetical protein